MRRTWRFVESSLPAYAHRMLLPLLELINKVYLQQKLL